MLLHQTDKLLIGPLQNQIMETFKINYTQWGLINTSALIVGAICYPLWGWLYDHFSRPKLLALASMIWGCTTWLNAIAADLPYVPHDQGLDRHRRLELPRRLQSRLRLLPRQEARQDVRIPPDRPTSRLSHRHGARDHTRRHLGLAQHLLPHGRLRRPSSPSSSSSS